MHSLYIPSIHPYHIPTTFLQHSLHHSLYITFPLHPLQHSYNRPFTFLQHFIIIPTTLHSLYILCITYTTLLQHYIPFTIPSTVYIHTTLHLHSLQHSLQQSLQHSLCIPSIFPTTWVGSRAISTKQGVFLGQGIRLRPALRSLGGGGP